MSTISLIAAMTENLCLGKDNKMPWHLPADLAHFKKMTLEKTIIMGRKTFQSLGRPLPKRKNVIVTRQQDFAADGCIVMHDLEAAIQKFSDEEEVMIIGGAQIYQQALPLANCMYLTFIHAIIEGDAYFPKWQEENWQQIAIERHVEDEKNNFSYDFVTLKRC